MNLYQAIKYMYPELTDEEFILKDDGNGLYILKWTSELRQPTIEELIPIAETIALDAARMAKKDELDKACTETIYGYFSATVDGVDYEFSYDGQAQSRFNGIAALFALNAVTNIDWTAYRNGERIRINLDKPRFLQVAGAGAMHQDSNIKRFNAMLPNVDIATVDELKEIVW